MARAADYRVKIVDPASDADVNVLVVNSVVVDLSDAAPGDVLTIQPDGSIEADPPAAASLNLFIQDDPPVTALTSYQWWETAAGDLVTMWVEVP